MSFLSARRFAFLPSLLSALLVLPLMPRCGWSQGPRQMYDAVLAQNCVVCGGHLPFHIRIEAKLFSLEGDPAGTGTVEEWWASPGRYRIVTSGPDGEQVETSDGSVRSLPAIRRSNYLLRLLLDQSVNPLPPLAADARVRIVDRSMGSSQFRCFAVDGAHAENPTTAAVYCTEPDKMDLRVSNASSLEGAVRNQLARFHNASVAFQTAIRYGERLAIQGQVKSLQSLDVNASSFPELHTSPEATAAADKREEQYTSGVVAGHPVQKTMPQYPVDMRSAMPIGTVVLAITVSQDGHVSSMDVLASPTPSLTRAAEDAVRTWVFTPYTLEGKPIDAQSRVVVNFNGAR